MTVSKQTTVDARADLSATAEYAEGYQAASNEVAQDGWDAPSAQRFLAEVRPYPSTAKNYQFDSGFRARLAELAQVAS